jgi:hypothetical protein
VVLELGWAAPLLVYESSTLSLVSEAVYRRSNSLKALCVQILERRYFDMSGARRMLWLKFAALLLARLQKHFLKSFQFLLSVEEPLDFFPPT